MITVSVFLACFWTFKKAIQWDFCWQSTWKVCMNAHFALGPSPFMSCPFLFQFAYQKHTITKIYILSKNLKSNIRIFKYNLETFEYISWYSMKPKPYKPYFRIHFGYFWIHLDTFEYIWILGYVWVHLDTFGYIWLLKDTFRYFWIHLHTFEYIWLILAFLDKNWTFRIARKSSREDCIHNTICIHHSVQ